METVLGGYQVKVHQKVFMDEVLEMDLAVGLFYQVFEFFL